MQGHLVNIGLAKSCNYCKLNVEEGIFQLLQYQNVSKHSPGEECLVLQHYKQELERPVDLHSFVHIHQLDLNI